LKKPTEREFYDCCNEFWSVSTYVAKGVFRREILFALDHFNNILRPELLRMISWYIGFNRGFDFSLGKNYKFINKYLTDKEFNMLLATFEMNGYRKTYQSFKLCCELFKYYSNKVSCLGNYNYPNYEKNIENFIRNNYEN
ncbi:aminoglycoside 6-adenylyltransferase, partial [Staphylococcus aureus]